MTATVTPIIANASAAPFEIPPIITYAVPGFVLLIILEMIVVKATKKGRYEVADCAASLSMGLGNRISGILFGGFAVAAYFWVYQFRLFDLGWTAPVMAACFFAEDLAYYWFHRIAQSDSKAPRPRLWPLSIAKPGTEARPARGAGQTDSSPSCCWRTFCVTS